MDGRSTSFDRAPQTNGDTAYGPAAALRRRTLGLSAGEAVLGLVIEQPDSASRLCQRLLERFRSAQFTRSTAHNALTRLTRQGLVQLVAHETELAGEGRYEATPLGLGHFRAWVRGSTPTAPVLREELQAKVEFCAPEDLSQLIEAIHAEERACASMFAAAQGRLSGEELLNRGHATSHEHWSALTRRTMLRDEAAMWGMRFKRLERLRARLEELRGEAERCVTPVGKSRKAKRCSSLQGQRRR